MASSAPKIAAEEIRETLEAINAKADEIANSIKHSAHLVVFTGAGISTSAG